MRIMQVHFKVEDLPFSSFLKRHYDANAQSLDTLWIKIHALDRPISTDEKRNNALLDCPLALLFAFAPTAVCHSFWDILKKQPIDTYQHALYWIYRVCPPMIRVKITDFLNHLPESDIRTIFSLEQSWFMLAVIDPLPLTKLIITLKKTDLSPVIKRKHYWIPHTLVEVLTRSQWKKENLNGIVDFLENLPDESFSIIIGNSIFPNRRSNLLKELASAPTVAYLRIIIRATKLPETSIDHLVKTCKSDWFNPYTSLTLALERKEPQQTLEALAITLIDFMQRHPTLIAQFTKPKNTTSEPLLHVLVRHQLINALIYYLEQPKLPVNFDSKKKETPLAIAQARGDCIAIDLIHAHPIRQAILNPEETISSELETLAINHPSCLLSYWKNHQTLFYLAVLKGQVKLVKWMMKHLEKNPEEFISSLAENLINLPKTHEDALTFFEQLQTFDSAKTLCNNLEHACIDDAAGLILIQASAKLTSPVHKAALEWVRTALHRLSTGDSPLEKNNAQRQLFIFLFSMPIKLMIHFLTQLTLDETIQNELDLVLCHGMVQPAVYLRLTHDEFQAVTTLCKDKPRCHRAIAQIQLVKGDLPYIPPQTLQVLTEYISQEALDALIHHRPNPILMLLNIEKRIAHDAHDPTLPSLLATLDTALKRLDPDALDYLPQIRTLLNLATTPLTWETIKNSGILLPIQSLYEQHKHTMPLLAQGLLKHYFLEQANHPEDEGSSDLIASADVEDIEQLLRQHRGKFQLAKTFTQGILIHKNRKNLLPCLLQWSFYLRQDNALLLEKLPELLECPELKSSLETVLEDNWPQVPKPTAIALKGLILGCHYPQSDPIARLNSFHTWFKEEEGMMTSKALVAWARSYASWLYHPDAKNVPILLIGAFAALLAKGNYTFHRQCIDELPLKFTHHLIENAILGLSSADETHQDACKTVLNCLSLMDSNLNETTRLLIISQLNTEDLSLLGTSDLRSIADAILKEKKPSDLQQATLNGCWIQRLITTPRFVAASTPGILHTLVTRYRMLSQLLKQNELEHLTQTIKTNPTQQATWHDKRQRLLKFRADHAVRALLEQVEKTCTTGSNTEQLEVQGHALRVLYQYHATRLMNLRQGLFYHFRQYLYNHTVGKMGDLEILSSTLHRWIDTHLKHDGLIEQELRRKTSSLFDAQAKEIGFINEANFAMTHVNQELCPLIGLDGFEEGHVFYDKVGYKIGSLGDNGQIIFDNLFSKNTAAQLLAYVPLDQLQNNALAVDLLLKDVLQEKAVETLLTASELDQEEAKPGFIAEKLSAFFVQIQNNIAPKNMADFVQYQSPAMVLTTLNAMKHSTNAHGLFVAILANERQRHHLFSNAGLGPHPYFERFKTATILAKYLVGYQDQSWFETGLTLFIRYSTRKNTTDLLTNAFLVLANQVENQDLPEEKYQALLTQIISTDSLAKLVLRGFLNDPNMSIQTSDTRSIEHFTYLFGPIQVLAAMEKLNTQSSWTESATCRLLLMTLHKHHKCIFNQEELRLVEFWKEIPLKEAVCFTVRHMGKAHHDHQKIIGKKLLSDLVLRTANYGLVDLFYSEGKINPSMLHMTINRTTANAYAARFYLPRAIKKAFNQFKSWFSDTHQEKEKITRLLEEHQAIIDWKILSNDAWDTTDNDELPLICAFLINYTGASGPIQDLLTDFMNIPNLHAKQLHHIAQLMAKFPKRGVSSFIFDMLSKITTKNPTLLDDTLLHQMTAYRILSLDLTEDNALGLVRHFAHSKQYALVSQCCKLLHSRFTKNPEFQEKLQQINKEAHIEAHLHRYLKKWYFSILKFFYRAWHYNNDRTGYIPFCEDPAGGITLLPLPKMITTPAVSGKFFATLLTIAEQRQQLRLKYAKIPPASPVKQGSAGNALQRYSLLKSRPHEEKSHDEKNPFIPKQVGITNPRKPAFEDDSGSEQTLNTTERSPNF